MEYEKLRNDFLSILKKNELRFVDTAKEIGITYQTFLNFLRNNRQINTKTTWKIERWLSKKHQSKT